MEPLGFSLRWASTSTKEVDFVRPSFIQRLYEHVNIKGAGKEGEVVYATTAISGSVNPTHYPCFSDVDHDLMYALETDKERHWTRLRTIEDAREWEQKLARIVDLYCRRTAQMKGPALFDGLQPAFVAVDRYIDKLGTTHDVFDSEYQYFADSTDEQKRDAEQMAFSVGHLKESAEDVELACLVLTKFASEIEGRTNPFQGKKVHEDSDLRTRVYLLVDYVRDQRRAYQAS